MHTLGFIPWKRVVRHLSMKTKTGRDESKLKQMGYNSIAVQESEGICTRQELSVQDDFCLETVIGPSHVIIWHHLFKAK